MRLLALGIFAVAAVSDAIDGYVARHYKQKSNLGAFLDPLADKLLLVSGAVLLSINNRFFPAIPVYFVITIVSRDLITGIGAMILTCCRGKFQICPRWSGKVATCLQMLTIVFGLIVLDAEAEWCRGLRLLAILATIFTIISGVCYIYDGIKVWIASSPKKCN